MFKVSDVKKKDSKEKDVQFYLENYYSTGVRLWAKISGEKIDQDTLVIGLKFDGKDLMLSYGSTEKTERVRLKYFPADSELVSRWVEEKDEDENSDDDKCNHFEEVHSGNPLEAISGILDQINKQIETKIKEKGNK